MLEVCTEDWRCVCVCVHAVPVEAGLLLHMLSHHVGARYQTGVLCKSSLLY